MVVFPLPLSLIQVTPFKHALFSLFIGKVFAMVSTKAGVSLSLLQLATLLSQVSAKTCTPCRPNTALLVLLRAEPGAPAFCGDILGVATSTVGLTVTPTV